MFSPQEWRIRHQRYSGLIQFAPQPFGLTRTGKLWKPLLFSFFWNWCLSLNRNEKIHLGISQWPEYTFSEVWKKMGNETLAHEPHTRHKRWCLLTHLPSSTQTLPPSHPTWPEALPRFPGVGPAKHLFDARHSSGPQCWCSSKSKKGWTLLLYLIIVEHSNWNQTTCTLQLKCWESSMKTCHLGGLHTDRLVDLFWITACWKQFHSVHTSLAAKKWTNSHWNGMTLIIRSHTNFLAVAVETNTHPRSPNGTSMTLGVNFAGDKFSALSSCT